ncbi:Ppx/GppA phosphatase family protein [Phytohalomonas tamaricis]|uniref:Ppx/GppA phosphatase family protein n=1 Tax=Phytohalomonas tamaricis TaxID=2081032 RepID=UPI000D0BE5BB|nr:Ppx/GppA phosphatase family protein [Phytohalomonas tamaricis]
MHDHQTGDALRRLAAIDLGSNSFHLLIAHHVDGQFHVIEKRSEKVQLAAGLDDNNCLTDTSMERALACLSQFAVFLKGIDSCNIRIVGTNALRNAANSETFVARSEAVLGQPIEIIAGREEARLIYLGAAHALADVHGKRLIVDIGGGSTELIIGEHFDPLALESLEMGCVTYTKRFFKDDLITEQHMRAAEREALSELANIRKNYLALGWDDPVGTSGTIKAAALVLGALQLGDGTGITRKGLMALRARLIECGRLDKVAMDGLKEDRARVFPAGIAILSAVFEALELDVIRYANGALRDGVLYDLIGRNTPQDSRQHSVETLAKRFDIDTHHAHNVATCALELFDQVRDKWQLDDESRLFLNWAARLHEVGLAISHSRFHKHGGYLIENTDLAGFSRPEQSALAFLVRAHRRKFPLKEAGVLTQNYRQRCIKIARLLRLAVVLNHARHDQPVEGFTLDSKGEELTLKLPEQATTPLLIDDLTRECVYQQEAGFTLKIVT